MQDNVLHPVTKSEISPAAGGANLEFIFRVNALAALVEFKNYILKGTLTDRGEFYVQATYVEPDIYTGVAQTQYTRKWLLTPAMTDSEIVQTLFKLCLTSMEHRTREAFTYKGARIFGPHFDVNDLADLCREREDAGGREFGSRA